MSNIHYVHTMPYFKIESKTDTSDFTKFCMKIGPVQDLQEYPSLIPNKLKTKKEKLQEVSSPLRLDRRKSCDLWTDTHPTDGHGDL